MNATVIVDFIQLYCIEYYQKAKSSSKLLLPTRKGTERYSGSEARVKIMKVFLRPIVSEMLAHARRPPESPSVI
jgi:hypothetical protein